MRVCAVVVTYNRQELLVECLKALQQQTRPLDQILVVDNASTDGTAEFVKENYPDLVLLELNQNLGGAGGFNAGMQWAFDNDFDWAWVMDDDALPLENSLACLKPFLEQYKDSISVLCSRLVQQTPNNLQCDEQIKVINKAMFVGFAVSRKAIEQVGLPRKDFFIYTDDSEYCLRIRKARGNIYQINSSLILHADWKLSKQNKAINIFGKEFLLYPILPAWKKYYLARNRILIGRTHSARLYILGTAQTVIFLFATLIFSPKDVSIVAKGLWHGLFGKFGAKVKP